MKKNETSQPGLNNIRAIDYLSFSKTTLIKHGSKTVLVVAEDADLQQLLLKHSSCTSGRPRSLAIKLFSLGKGIVMEDSDKTWICKRKVTLKGLHYFVSLSGFSTMLKKLSLSARNLLTSVLERMQLSDDVKFFDGDLTDSVKTMVIQFVIATSTGQTNLPYQEVRELQRHISCIFRSLNPNCSWFYDDVLFIRKLLTSTGRHQVCEVFSAVSRTESILSDLIQESICSYNQKAEPKCILHVLMQSCPIVHSQNGTETFDIYAVMCDLILASVETLSAGIAWIIKAIFSNREYESFDQILNEVSIAPLGIPHRATEVFSFKRLQVPRDAIIITLLKNCRSNFFQKNFGIGKRSCIGGMLARKVLQHLFIDLGTMETGEKSKDVTLIETKSWNCDGYLDGLTFYPK